MSEIIQQTTTDLALHCIEFILFHVKDVRDVYNDYELQCKFYFKVFGLGENSN